MAKLLLMAALLVDYVYVSEFFMAYYGGNHYERHLFLSRYFEKFGPFWWAGCIMLFCNLFTPQLLWIRPIRRNLLLLFIICQIGTVGMWFERFVIIVPPITEDFLPSSWHIYHPTWVEQGTFAGTLGLFFTMVLLFIRFIPIVSIAELKGVLPQADPHHDNISQPMIP
jgi:molybdopterin-containing oxidoreductase family membrane subunit